ncbi:protein of unknown function [Legionella fallonii LLAP-10]|uniref:Uncharacterized protein n=1 Tax=Legionella fallonii LLAP-10 TaxID=1212491 RepID=A0A098G170_9GAMM|nr:protein of unknown function [Legionella fallonii LLAP-10]
MTIPEALDDSNSEVEGFSLQPNVIKLYTNRFYFVIVALHNSSIEVIDEEISPCLSKLHSNPAQKKLKFRM